MSHAFWSPHSLSLGDPRCPHQAWRCPSPALGLLPQAAVSSGSLSNFPMFTPLSLPRPWASLGWWPSFQTRQGTEPSSTSVGRQAGPTMPAPGSPQPKLLSPHVSTYTVLLSHHALSRHTQGRHNVCTIHPFPGSPASTQCLFRISTTFPDKITYCPTHRTLRHILPRASPSTQLANRGPQKPGPPYFKRGWGTLQAIPGVPGQCPLPTSCKS